MTEETKKSNTFEEMEKKAPTGNKNFPGVKIEKDEKTPGSGEVKASKEISVEDFSDTAVGDKVKYVRPDLDGKDDVIEKFQVFQPDINKASKSFQNNNGAYWPVTMIMHLESKNEEDVQNREYISGARAFVQDDGSPSDISFWYEGSETQAAYVWELVAKSMEVEAKDLSPRQFISFLNMKPKVKMIGKDYKNYGAPVGAPKTIKKNMPGEFTK